MGLFFFADGFVAYLAMANRNYIRYHFPPDALLATIRNLTVHRNPYYYS